jgi:hypothetical protein
MRGLRGSVCKEIMLLFFDNHNLQSLESAVSDTLSFVCFFNKLPFLKETYLTHVLLDYCYNVSLKLKHFFRRSKAVFRKTLLLSVMNLEDKIMFSCQIHCDLSIPTDRPHTLGPSVPFIVLCCCAENSRRRVRTISRGNDVKVERHLKLGKDTILACEFMFFLLSSIQLKTKIRLNR